MMHDPGRRRLFATGLGTLGVAGLSGVAARGGAEQAEAGVVWAATRAAVGLLRITADATALIVARYDASSPVCPARYVRATAIEPSGLRSLDGAYWTLAEPVIDVAMLGTGEAAIRRALAALGERPGTVRLRGERYRITAPLRLRSGQALVGAGWASREDSTVIDGSTVLALDGTEICLDIVGTSGERPVERACVASLAIVGTGTGRGIRVRDARHLEFQDLYLYRLETGIWWEATAWMGVYSRIQCFACKTGFDLNSGAEDSIFSGCIVRYADIACRINYHAQTNHFVGCDFGYARVAVQMIGAIGKRVNASFDSCIFEYKQAGAAPGAIFDLTAPASRNLLDYPSVSCRACRFHSVDGATDATIFLARRANLISMTDCRAGSVMATIVRCDDASSLGGVVLSGNEAVARVVAAGDGRLMQRIEQLTPGAR